MPRSPVEIRIGIAFQKGKSRAIAGPALLAIQEPKLLMGNLSIRAHTRRAIASSCGDTLIRV